MLEFVLQGQDHPAAGTHRHVGGDDRREGPRRRAHARELAHDDRRLSAFQLDDGQLAMLLEGRLGFARPFGKRDPELHAPQAPAVLTGVSSACAIPRPAVIRLSTPGPASPSRPRLSWWITSPSISHDTV